MNRAGTGVGKFTALFSVPTAAHYVLELAIVAAGYAGLAEAGQMLPSINLTATPLWPPSGFALALFLLRGYRIWPAILLGSFFSSEIAARSFLASGFVGAGTLLAALAGAWLIDRWSNGRKTFETPLGVANFALVSFVPTAMMSSGIVSVGLFLTNDASFDNDVTWASWWLADATGILVIAPVIVLWATTPLRPFSKWSLLETAAILILATAIGITAFSPLVGSAIDVPQTYQSLFGFFILLPLMWAGLCGNQRNAATVAFIF